MLPQRIHEFYKNDLNINKFKLHRDVFHNIIKDQGLTVSSFANVLNIFKDKPHLVIFISKRSFSYVKKIEKLLEKYYDTKTVKQFSSSQLP